MTRVENLEDLRRCLGGRELSAFGSLRRLVVSGCPEESSRGVRLVFDLAEPRDGTCVRLRLEGVRGLQMKRAVADRLQVTGLYAENVRSRGWERIDWQIGDYEEGVISCWAASLEVRVRPARTG